MDNTTDKNSDGNTSDSMGNQGIDISTNNQSNGVDKPNINGEKRDENGRFIKGWEGGPGRPKGSISPIARLKQMFEEDPQKFEKFVKDYGDDPANRKHVVEMIDGKPKQTIAGDSENPLRIITVDKDLAEINDIIASQSENHSEGQE